jgi:2-(1,2-epoxy-1,2-dihydrophenyl)acetyl-CoA isomerase
MTDTVLLDVADGVGTLTLNRPDSMNALDVALTRDFIARAAEAEADSSIRCVVLRGAGDAFQAGGDIKSFHGWIDREPEQRRSEIHKMIHDMHPTVMILRRMPKPVVASVHGAAAGFGMSLMLACDLVVVAEDCVFTMAYANLGTSPDGSSTYSLPRVVGLKRAMELALLAERFDAARAYELGLVNRVVPAAELEAETMKLARRLAAGPTRAYAHTKALLNRSLQSAYEEQLQAELESFGDCVANPDFVEGVHAFVEKRKPAFKGS